MSVNLQKLQALCRANANQTRAQILTIASTPVAGPRLVTTEAISTYLISPAALSTWTALNAATNVPSAGADTSHYAAATALLASLWMFPSIDLAKPNRIADAHVLGMVTDADWTAINALAPVTYPCGDIPADSDIVAAQAANTLADSVAAKRTELNNAVASMQHVLNSATTVPSWAALAALLPADPPATAPVTQPTSNTAGS